MVRLRSGSVTSNDSAPAPTPKRSRKAAPVLVAAPVPPIVSTSSSTTLSASKKPPARRTRSKSIEVGLLATISEAAPLVTPPPSAAPATHPRSLTSHIGRFVDWAPQGVEALSACPSQPWLAVGRDSGDVELWELNKHTLQQFLVVPCPDSHNLRALAWVGQRLFGGGLNGKVWECHVPRLEFVQSESYGGAVWAMAAHPAGQDVLALACEDGRLRLARPRPLEPGLDCESKPLSGGAPSRLLSVAWHGPHALLAGGLDGKIRKWSVESNRVVATMVAPSLGREQPPAIWALDTNGSLLASGDALGRVSVWDADLGVLLYSFHEHRADVMAVRFSPDGSTLFAAGVDPRVSSFKRLPGDEAKWVYSYSHRPHTHDVKALALLGEFIVSGGVDAQLCSVHAPKFESARPHKESPFRQDAVAHVGHLSPTQHLLLVQHRTEIQVWHVNSETQQRTLVMHMAFEGKPLFACAMSRDASQVAVSDGELRLFELDYDSGRDEELVVRRRTGPGLSDRHGAAVALVFGGLENLLVAAMQSGCVAVISRKQVLKVFEQGAGSCVRSLAVSPDGQWLAAASLAEAVHVYSLDSLTHQASLKLALFVEKNETLNRHACLAFSPHSGNLVLVRANGLIYEFTVEEKRLLDKIVRVPVLERLAGVCFNPAPEDKRVYVWGLNALCAVEGEDVKIAKLQQAVHVEFIGPDELIYVLAPWINVVRHLPDVLERKMFGS